MTGILVDLSTRGRDVHVGTLHSSRRRGVESSTFSYSAGFLAEPEAYALDPALPLSSGTHFSGTGRALFGALSDCAPDRWGRTLMDRREARAARAEGRAPRSLGEIDYLLGVRDDLRQGQLRFRAEAGPYLADEDSGVPALTDLPALLDLATRAESDTADLDDLERLVRVGSSLGGARPKAHVQDTDGRVAIAKFPSARYDTWNVMAWEQVALDLAREAGIDVPASQLLDLAGRHVLVLDRFDRTSAGERVGYASAMTMLEATDGRQATYLEIAEVVENTSATVTKDLEQLWRRIVLGVLISNTDDHLRNHGFLHVRGDVWRLAPAFDLNPDPSPGPTYLSTPIADADDRASVRTALSVADYFRLDADRAAVVLVEVADAVRSWRTVASRRGLSGAQIHGMAPAFSALEEAARVLG